MWSVPSRRSEFSTSRTIHRREPPREFGSSLIGMKNLVARTTSSRRPWSASPTISSDTPPEYTSAVSTKLMPASRARWMIRMESARSSLPHGPNIMAPRHRGLTWTPVRPSGRYCMAVPFFVSGGERLLGGRDGGHRPRPAGVERQVGDGLDDLGLGEPVLLTELQVEGQLLGVAPGDQRRDRDEAAVAWGQLGALPHVAEQDVVGERDQLGREVAQHLRRGRLLWVFWHGGASLGGRCRRPARRVAAAGGESGRRLAVLGASQQCPRCHPRPQRHHGCEVRSTESVACVPPQLGLGGKRQRSDVYWR